jgi:hypothetical protein
LQSPSAAGVLSPSLHRYAHFLLVVPALEIEVYLRNGMLVLWSEAWLVTLFLHVSGWLNVSRTLVTFADGLLLPGPVLR